MAQGEALAEISKHLGDEGKRKLGEAIAMLKQAGISDGEVR